MKLEFDIKTQSYSNKISGIPVSPADAFMNGKAKH